MKGKMKVTAALGTLLLCAGLLAGGLPSREVQAASDTKIVVLDPGHGGGESGAWSTHGGVTYKEEELNWKITNYTKQALEQYGNIKVYLTRTKNQYMGVSARAEKAASLNADLLVSQHLNSAGASAHGASVMISKGTYRPEIAKKEKAFGSLVMQELGNLGIYKRFPETGGMEYRLSENGSKYPNGGARDYYGIVARSVELNMAGVIIEHCFISNYNDATRFLSTEAKLKQLGQADAKAIAKYLQLDFKNDGWTQEGGKWYYYVDGKKKTGWIYEGNHKYYCDSNGVRQHGWLLTGGRWYYLEPETGRAVTNKLLNLNGEIYYLDQSGVRQKGFTWVGNYCFYFHPDTGRAHKGWHQSSNGNWRYMGTKTGRILRDTLLKNDGKYYYLGKDGIMAANTWETVGGKRYYFKKDGSAATGWFILRGKYYFANSQGQVAVNRLYRSPGTGKVCYLDSTGARVTGWKKVGQDWYYMDPKNGVAVGGWVSVGGKWYYMDPKTYIMETSTWIKDGGKKYYLDEDGVMLTGLKKIGGQWYYMDGSGAQVTGWKRLSGNWYFFKPSTGVMLRGVFGKIGGKTFQFAGNGVCLNPPF